MSEKRDIRRDVASLKGMVRDGSLQSLGQALELIRAGASPLLHAKLLEGCRLVDGVPHFGAFFSGPRASEASFQAAFLVTLGTLPPETGCASSLRTPERLDLSGWRPLRWPDELPALRSIRQLRFDGCLDAELPAFVLELSTLERLSIARSRFTRLREGMGSLPLTHFDGRDAPLDALPADFFRAPLVEVDVRGCPLAALPANLSECTSLRSLRLRSAPLSGLPENIGSLSSLELLEVSRGQLITLPSSIVRLAGLRSLLLEDNRLQALPASLAEMEALEDLGVERNALRALPESLSQLPRLRKLRASFNKLDRVPPLPSSLRLLTLGGNPIDELPEGALEPALRHLDLRECPLSEEAMQALSQRTGTTLA